MNTQSKLNKFSIFLSILFILLAISLTVAGSYAFYVASNNLSDFSISSDTASLKLTYSNRGEFSLNCTSNADGDCNYTKTVSVKNTGTDTIRYGLYLDNSVNEGLTGLKYSITGVTTGSHTPSILGETDLPSDSSTNLYVGTLSSGETHTLHITISYKSTGSDQSNEIGKTFSTQIKVRGV